MTTEVMITTIDNPFDPFDDFDNWFLFDTEKGYYTSSRLCRIASFEDDMTEKEQFEEQNRDAIDIMGGLDMFESLMALSDEQFEELERAIDRLIEIDPLNIYKKVTKEIKND